MVVGIPSGILTSRMRNLKLPYLAQILFCMILITSCATVGDSPQAQENDLNRDPDAVAMASGMKGSLPQTVDEIEKELAATNPVLSEAGGEPEKVPLHIPIEINRNVAQWIQFFSVRERAMTERYFERGEALRPHIEQILKENDVPPELYYLAMIESGFVRSAKSHAKAVGVWQFMPGTARNYGLRVNNVVDERRNWIKSTEAAASYLKDLNNVFGSWYLALAAYNAGEYRIVRSIMKGKTRDFWSLAEAGLLPKETLNYVPKYLAAHIIGKHKDKYGFNVTVPDSERWAPFETVSVPSGVRLRDLAKITGTSQDVLKRWNFDLLKDVTPSEKSGTVDIYIPKDYLPSFEKEKEAIAKLQRVKGLGDQRVYASSKDERGSSYDIYVVRRGDNLSTISKRIGTSVRTLIKVNGLKKKRIHPGQRLKFYPKVSEAKAPKSARALSSSSKSRKN